MLFRSTGLPLESITSLIAKEDSELHSSLEHRLFSINNEIQGLKNQQKVILKILAVKEARIGEQALPEMMDDYRNIEADEKGWQGAKKEELDYIRAMVHGLRDVTEDSNEPPME